MLEMYAPMVNSPITELSDAIDAEQTTIEVVDGSKLPDAPNLAMIGLGENTETILYTQKDGNVLSGVTRGFQGVAKAWPQGTRVARFFAAYDQMAIQENIKTLDQSLAAHLNDFAQVWSNRIVEMGSNANGTYVRWENGLQICWADRSVINWPAQPTANQGSYHASDFTWTFPASFIDANIIITASPGYVGREGAWGLTTIYYASVTTTSVRLRLWTAHDRPDISNGTAVAIGRWK